MSEKHKQITLAEVEAIASKIWLHDYARLAESYRLLVEESKKMLRAANQASLLLFACNGPREAFKARELLEAVVQDFEAALPEEEK